MKEDPGAQAQKLSLELF